jgi:hypothetical protein
VKLVQLFGFITKKFVTLHGHVNVKYTDILMSFSSNPSSKILCVDRSHAHSLLECHPNRRAIGTNVHFVKFLNWHVLFEGGKDRQNTTDFLRDANFISFATTCFGLCRLTALKMAYKGRNMSSRNQ